MPDVILPPMPPLPPPVGSAVRPSVSAGSPPPPTGPPAPAPAPDDSSADDRYLPPEWLDKQRGNGRTSSLNPKVVILSIVGIGAAFLATVVVLIVLVGTTDSRVVEIPVDDIERPRFADEEMFVDSMADPSAERTGTGSGPA